MLIHVEAYWQNGSVFTWAINEAQGVQFDIIRYEVNADHQS